MAGAAAVGDPSAESWCGSRLSEVPCSAEVSELPLTGYGVWSDLELFLALAAQDPVAYGELYRRHASSIRAVARVILGNRADCDDIVTEVLVGLWISPGQFDPERGSLLGFLRLKAKGRSIDMLRSEGSRTRRERNDLLEAKPQGQDVESTVIATASAAQLRRAVAALPASEREPIRLAYFENMTYRAVALYLNEPEGTVKTRIRHGLHRLRSQAGELGLA